MLLCDEEGGGREVLMGGVREVVSEVRMESEGPVSERSFDRIRSVILLPACARC